MIDAIEKKKKKCYAKNCQKVYKYEVNGEKRFLKSESNNLENHSANIATK